MNYNHNYNQDDQFDYPEQSQVQYQDIEQQQNTLISHHKIHNIEQSITNAFIKKVFSIVFVQLLITVALCWLSMENNDYARFQKNNSSLIIIASVLIFIISIMTCCCHKMFRKVPSNYILLLIFTVCEGYLVSLSCSLSDPKIVVMAVSMTMAITFGLVLYALTTKTDITVYGSALFIFGVGLIMFGVFAIFTDNKMVHILLSVGGVILYGFYLVYDVQLIARGKKYKLSVDDYILGAIMIYIDIVGLFLELLRLLTELKK